MKGIFPTLRCGLVVGLMAAAGLAAHAAVPQRGQADKTPTAQNIQQPRPLASMGYAGPAQRDSVMSATPPSGQARPSTVIKLPTGCDMNNTLPGCSGYCAAHPGAYGCGGEPLPGKI